MDDLARLLEIVLLAPLRLVRSVLEWRSGRAERERLLRLEVSRANQQLDALERPSRGVDRP